VSDDFLHVETIESRSSPNDWHIRTHSHANLNHVLHVGLGGGRLIAETLPLKFTAPCLVLIPARVVHAFDFERATAGSVLTLSEAYLRDLLVRDSELADLFQVPLILGLSNGTKESTTIAQCLDDLVTELTWRAPSHKMAVEARLLSLLITTYRVQHHTRGEVQRTHSADAQLVANFRHQLETSYRSGLAIEAYARKLKVSPAKLRSACVKSAGCSPLEIVQQRIVLEAKRLLLYSNVRIAEVGYFLGFEDPAYFTRFLTKWLGQSPRVFRRRVQE
jgi:AraC family transcriptional activator of pobA